MNRESITILIIGMLLMGLFSCRPSPLDNTEIHHGAITRFNDQVKTIYLVFTGHEFADGFETITTTLEEYQIGASFFFTGDFYRHPPFEHVVRKLLDAGHYLGAHSDQHLLYASWDNRDSLLVTRQQFMNDLERNYEEMEKFGISKKSAPYFLPPYEWYNFKIAEWTSEMDLILINFTPGTDSNQDWSYPEDGIRYFSSDTIFDRILQYEQTNPHGLNGFILLLHIGSDPRRPDKFHERLPALIDTLMNRGYAFKRLPV